MQTDIKFEKVEELLFDGIKPVTELRVVYPVIGGHITRTAEEKFNSFYLANAKAANKFARTELYPQAREALHESEKTGFPFNVYTFYRDSKTAYKTDKFVSILTETYIYTGGAHGSSTRVARTWSVESGVCLPVEAFFPRGVNHRQLILRSVTEQIGQMKTEGCPFYMNAERLAVKNISAAGIYPSGEREVSVFYPEYVIAPHCAGIVTFKVKF